MARWMKDPELARRVVDEWARQAPNDPKLPDHQVNIEFEAGSYRRAIALVDAILAKKPAAAEENRWQGVRAKAVTKLQTQAREVAEVPAK
jgi:predicted Zn-dependent protease